MSLTYQDLINNFWNTAAANANKSENAEKAKVKQVKPNNIKIINKQGQFDTQYQHITPQQTISVTTPSSVNNDVHAVNLKDISEAATAANLLEHGSLIKGTTVLPKMQNQGVNPNSLTSIVVNSDVSLASGLQYPDMPPTMLNPPLPKYQQALQQQINVQQQPLAENSETGKVTFPKHVFSQARFVNKKQQQQMVASEQPRVTCDICQKSLKTKKMLWAHKVAVHFGGNFPCEICGKKCITGAELRRHLTSHSAERKFVCQYCGLAYKRWSHLYQHLRVHEEEKNFRCDVCHINFKVQSELKDHCFAEHSNGDMVQCSVCKHKLQTPLAVYHHSMKHTGTRDFICEICGSNFKRKQHLVTHMKTHLTENKGADGSAETYECQVCDHTFSLKMELKAHCESAHPLEGSETALCKTCNKRLNLSHSVYLHGLRHCGSRDFQCDECQQLFKRKAHLLRHKLDRHPEVPRERKKRAVQNEPIVCHLCRRTFKYKTALVKHMAGQHGVLPKSDYSPDSGIVFKKGIKKPHQCEKCLKRFKSKGSLRKHKLNKHGIGAEVSILIQYGEENETQSASNIHESVVEIDGDNASATMVPASSIMLAESNSDHTEEENRNSEIKADAEETPEKMQVDDDITSSGREVLTASSGNVASIVASARQSGMVKDPPRQVITVDQETGQLILIESNGVIEEEESTVTEEKEQMDASTDHGQVVGIQSDGADSSTIQNNQGQVISVQPDPMQTGTLSTPQESNSDDVTALSQANSQIAVGSLNQQVSLGQIINQDGVTLTTMPIQSVQGLTGTENIIDFTQSNNEQIVVLLSALNSQGMQPM